MMCIVHDLSAHQKCQKKLGSRIRVQVSNKSVGRIFLWHRALSIILLIFPRNLKIGKFLRLYFDYLFYLIVRFPFLHSCVSILAERKSSFLHLKPFLDTSWSQTRWCMMVISSTIKVWFIFMDFIKYDSEPNLFKFFETYWLNVYGYLLILVSFQPSRFCLWLLTSYIKIRIFS